MNVDEEGLRIPATGLKKDVREARTALQSLWEDLGKLERSILAFKSPGTDLTGPLARIKKFAGGSIDAINEAQEKALLAIKNGNTKELNLAREHNKALQAAYSARLALKTDLTIEELQSWKKLGVGLGGIQAAILKDELDFQKNRAVASKGLQADMLKDEMFFQKSRETLANGLHADMLKDELEFQKSRETVANGLHADMLKDELSFQKARETVANGLHADMLKDELSFQKARETVANGLHADMLRDELDFQKSRETIANGLHADMLKDELSFQKARETVANGLHADMLKDELAYQKAREKIADGLHADMLKDELEFQKAQSMLQKKAADDRNHYASIQVLRATQSPMGSFSSLSSGKVVEPKQIQEVDKLSKSFRQLTVDGNDVHSMARGLASGFNLLWLTWGNLAPLFIGAAISNGFMQTVKQGMKVADTLEAIAVLGEATTTEMAALESQLISLGRTGPFGPLAIADAMKLLSLAGLQASEIIGALPTVLNFSIAGATDVKTAADTLVSVATAFDMGSQGFGRVADVISKTAAESKSSVESFSSAMKTASVVSAQYGVTLEDIAVQVAMLAQLGIQGTAAGTAIRNMYADLSGRSAPVTKALKSMGIELREVTGRFKPMLEIVGELDTKLRELEPIAQANYLQKILSERGGKDMIEALRLIRTEVSNFPNALAKLRDSAENSFGFTAISAAKMAQTVQKQFDGIGASIGTTLFAAFKQAEPALYLFANELRALTNSQEFVDGLAGMVKAVVNLARAVLENKETLAVLVLGYFALKGALVAVTAAAELYTIASRTKTAVTLADTVATDANTAAEMGNKAAKLGAMAGFAKAIPVLGTILTIGAAAWATYELYQGAAINTAENASASYNSNILKALQAEIDKQLSLNALMRSGMSLKEATAAFNSKQDLKAGVASMTSGGREAAGVAYQKALKELAALEKDIADPTQSAYVVANRLKLGKATEKWKEASEGIYKAIRDESRAERELAAAQAKVAATTAANVRLEEERSKQATDALDAALKGAKTLADIGLDGGDRGAAIELAKRMAAEKRAYDAASENIADKLREQEAQLKSNYATELALLDSKNKNGLISEGEYQGAQLVQLVNYEAAASKVRKAAYEDQENKYEARRKQMLSQGASAEALDELKKQYTNFTSGLRTADIEQNNAAILRMAKASDTAAGEVKKLQDSYTKFWQEDGLEAKKQEADLLSLTEVTSEYQRAVNVGASKATEKYAKQMLDLSKATDQAEQSLNDLIKSGAASTPEGQLSLIDSEEKLQLLRKQLREMDKDAAIGVARAGEMAGKFFEAQKWVTLRGSLAEAILAGLEQGGADGMASLRKLIEDEFLRKPIKIVIEGFLQDLKGGGSGGGLASAIESVLGSSSGSVASSISSIGSMPTSKLLTTGLQYFNNSLMKYGSNLASSLQAAGLDTMATYVSDGLASLSSGVGSVSSALTQYQGVIDGAGQALGYLSTAMLASEGKWGAALGTAIGTYFSPVFGYIGGKVGAFVDSIFGGGTSYDKDSGIKGTFSGSGFSGTGYKVVREEPNQFNSWFGASGSDVEKQVALSSAATDALSSQFLALKFQTVEFATSLGLGTSALANYTSEMKITTLTQADSEKAYEAQKTLADGGASSEAKTSATAILKEISDKTSAAIADNFVRMANEMASLILDSDFIRVGETAGDALARLSTGLTTVNAAFDLLNTSLLTVSLQGANTATSIIDAFGGLEAFTQSMSSYYDNFYSSEEKRLNTLDGLAKGLNSAGGNFSADALGKMTREGYRAIVDSTKAELGADSPLYVALIQMSEAFAGITDAAVASNENLISWQRKLDVLSGKTTQRELDKADAMLTADATTKLIIKDFYDLEDALAAAKLAAEAEENRLSWLNKYNVATGVTTQRELDKAEALRVGNDATDLSIIALYDYEDAQIAAKAALEALKTQTQKSMDDMVALWGDLTGAMLEIDKPAATLVEQWRDNSAKLKELTQGLADALGELPEPTALDKLRATLASLASATGGIADLNNQIFDLRVGQGGQNAVDLLRDKERSLYAQMQTSSDPGSIASQLASTTISRIKLQAEMADKLTNDNYAQQNTLAKLEKENRDKQIEALQTQIASAETLVDVVGNLKNYLAEMNFSDLSSMNPTDQLNAAKSLFESTLASAQGGDTNAMQNLQGYATSYLQEAQGYYGGATSQYAGIFQGVTGSLGQYSETPLTDVDLLTSQLEKLQALADSSVELQTVTTDTSNQQIAGLLQIRDALAVREAQLQQQADAEKAAAQAQIDALNLIVETQEAQIRQHAAEYVILNKRLEEISLALSNINNTNSLTAAAP